MSLRAHRAAVGGRGVGCCHARRRFDPGPHTPAERVASQLPSWLPCSEQRHLCSREASKTIGGDEGSEEADRILLLRGRYMHELAGLLGGTMPGSCQFVCFQKKESSDEANARRCQVPWGMLILAAAGGNDAPRPLLAHRAKLARCLPARSLTGSASASFWGWQGHRQRP